MERVVNSPSSTPPRVVAQMGDNRNSVEQEETSGLESQVGNMEPMKWTNEKHSLYLESMEASFVHQLHDSLDLLGWHSQKYASSEHTPCSRKHVSEHNSSGQFKVFQDGCWGKINFSRDETVSSKEDESGLLSSNPWIQHYRSGCRQHTRTPPSVHESNTKDDFPASEVHLGLQDFVCSNSGNSGLSLEVSDQNFTDADTKKAKKCRMQSSKRKKTTALATRE